MQQINFKVDPSLAAYIQTNTGGSASPYNWSPTTLGVASAPAKSDLSNPFTPNASGCITAECAASIEPNRAPSEGQIRYFGGLQALGGAAQSVGGAKLVAAGAATCVETFGAGCVVALFGGFEMLAGWDNVNTGTQTGIDGRGHATTGGELFQMAGLSPGYAEMGYAGLQFGAGLGGIGLKPGANNASLYGSAAHYQDVSVLGANNATDTVKVFRVEGGGNQRLLIDEAGNVNIPELLINKGRGPERNLYLNFGDEARAQQFLEQRLQQFPDNTIKSFDVPKSFLDELRATAVPEAQRSLYPTQPVIADPTKAPNQFGLTAEQLHKLRQVIVKGSGG